MADIEISALPAAITPFSDSDIIHSKQGLTDRKMTVAQLKGEVGSTGNNTFVAGGTANAITLTPAGKTITPSEYSEGYSVTFKVVSDNTSGVTINVDGLGVRNTTVDGLALPANILRAGRWVTFIYNTVGPYFELKTASSLGIDDTATSKRLVLDDFNLNFSEEIRLTASGAGDNSIVIGDKDIGLRQARLDLLSEDGSVYHTRLMRFPGVNGNTDLTHKGTGLLRINTESAADIQLRTSNATRVTIDGISGDFISSVPMHTSFLQNNGSTLELKTTTAHDLHLGTQNNTRVTIAPTGEVGINNTSPNLSYPDGKTLVLGNSGDVDIGMTLMTTPSGASNIFFADGVGGVNGRMGLISFDHSVDVLYLGTNATPALFIDSTQRVGIGNSSMASYDASADDFVIGNDDVTGGSHGMTIVGGATGQSAIHLVDNSASEISGIEYSHTQSRLSLFNKNSSGIYLDTSDNLRKGVDDSLFWNEANLSASTQGCLVWNSALQSFNHNGIILSFNSEEYNTVGVGLHDISTTLQGDGYPLNTRFIVPAGYSKVEFTVQAGWTATADANSRELLIMKNGSFNFAGASRVRDSNPSNLTYYQTFTTPVYHVLPGDYFQFFVAHDQTAVTRWVLSGSDYTWVNCKLIQ